MNVCAGRSIAPKCFGNVTGSIFLHSCQPVQGQVSQGKHFVRIANYCGQRFTHFMPKRLTDFHKASLCQPCHAYATQPQKETSKGSKGSSLTESTSNSQSEITVGQKVAQAGKDVTYTGIVIAGIGITGLMFYAIGRELLSGNSPNGVYRRAVKMVNNNDDVYVALGKPLKAYGETTRRGRRRYTSHAEYEKEGVKHMRMKFYVKGPSGRADVHLEAKQDDRGNYDFRYIFVEAANQRDPIIVLDNR